MLGLQTANQLSLSVGDWRAGTLLAKLSSLPLKFCLFNKSEMSDLAIWAEFVQVRSGLLEHLCFCIWVCACTSAGAHRVLKEGLLSSTRERKLLSAEPSLQASLPLLIFGDQFLLCSLGWPGILYVNKPD